MAHCHDSVLEVSCHRDEAVASKDSCLKPGAGQEAELRGVLRGLAVEWWPTFVFVDEALLEEACGAVAKLDGALSFLGYWRSLIGKDLINHDLDEMFAAAPQGAYPICPCP